MTEFSYVGTNFSHNIPFSQYENLSNEEILQKYQDTTYEPEITGICTYVVDGDTIDVEVTHNNISEIIRVRLVSINTPEKNQNGYATSKKFMEKICLNKEIGLNIDDEKQTDTYGRTLALVIIDNKNLNEILVHEGLAEIMYIPPTEFSPYEWNNIVPPEEHEVDTNPIHLNSTIINQKKKLFLYVTQSKNLVWPNKTYNYQVYVKNISGQTIENIKIYITNPREIIIPEKPSNTYTSSEYINAQQQISNYLLALECVKTQNQDDFDIEYEDDIIELLNKDTLFDNALTEEELEIIDEEINSLYDNQQYNQAHHTYNIPMLKTGQSVLINIHNCSIMQEGYYHVNFVAMGDETEIKTQSLLVKCGYENDNPNILHRIAFYNFSPYEDAYMYKASDFNDNVTQLTKVQTKPFEAYNQPFDMDELELDLYAQDMFLQNADDMPSMYLGRENWESNITELFEGHSLTNLIQKINQSSDIVDIDFLRVGNNEMLTDFQQIYPNGFIHRFGLLKSEFYKLLGIIPKISSINDDLFRWARFETEWSDFDQGPVTYPIRENDKWNQKPWCGTGYYVYETKTENDKPVYTIEKAIFTKAEDADLYVDNLMIFNSTHFIDNLTYKIMKRDWLPGIFYVEIPLRDIPANFYIPDVNEIQAIIELAKPYGLKGYPRFALDDNFMHKMSFNNIPNVIYHNTMNLGQYSGIDYHIRAKKYKQTPQGLKLINYGKTADHITFPALTANFISRMPLPNVCVNYSKDMNNVYHIPNNLRLFSPQYQDIFTETKELFITLSLSEFANLVKENYLKIDNIIYYPSPNDEPQSMTMTEVYQYVEQINTIQEEQDQEQENVSEEVTNPTVLIIIQDICDILSESFNITYPSIPNEDFNNMQMSQYLHFKFATSTSFDGKTLTNNSLNELLLKNPEDISFYLLDNSTFMPVRTQEQPRILEIPPQYKTLNYYNTTTSMVLNFEETREEPSAIKLYRQNLPPHVNINILFSNKTQTQDFIISYKLLYDDIYQISYKTNKKTEVVMKEIATKFDYLLCEINNISENKDLVKIYYGLDDKIYFITAFTTNLLEGNGYQTRISLTNDLTLSSKFTFSNGNLLFGNMRYAVSNIVADSYVDWYLSNKEYSNVISTDAYQIQEIPKTNTKWKNLYRINKDETSFAIFENDISDISDINNIELFLTDLNIPQNSIIDKIYLDIYADSREEVIVTPYYQTNTNIIHDGDNISSIFNITSYSKYYQNNLRYLMKQLRYYQEKENDKQINYYQQLIDSYNRTNNDINIDFSNQEPMYITNNYWNEVSFDTTEELSASSVQTMYLILEGYNYSNNVEIESQLVYYDGIEIPTKININTGYFYEKIPINYDIRSNMDELSVRFRFNNVQKIDLYHVKSEIYFTSKQNIKRENHIVDNITIDGLDKYFCNIDSNLYGDDIRNGLTIGLDFSQIQNYLKIYSVTVNILYHEQAFTNVIEIAPDFNTITATDTQGLLKGRVFDEKISDMRQDTYTTQKPNGEFDAGFELNNRIYQAFTAEEDNITSIEIKPNGKIGAPDNYLKIAILDNYDNLPNNVLKEIIVDTRQYVPINGEAYKFNIYVNNLIKGNTYWFSIEPLDKTKKGARRFFYSNHQIDNFKLLAVHDGDVINQHASLYFRLYSKQNEYSFKNVPYVFNSPYTYNKDINLVTEIQIYDGYIKNFSEASFTDICQYIINNFLNNRDNQVNTDNETDNATTDASEYPSATFADFVENH